MEVHNRNKGHPRLDVRKEFDSIFEMNSYEFSYQENLNYVHHVKFVMMKVFLFNILLVLLFIQQ
jgi:hypothetical protein